MDTTTTIQADDKASRASLSASSACTLYTLGQSPFSFYPSRTLQVNARGIGAIRLPLPARQAEITITHPDGSEIYTSTRDKVWSGDCILSHPKRGNLIRTEYFFGPNRDPVLRLLQSSSVLPVEITVKGRWASRGTSVILPEGNNLEWVYAKEKRPDGEKVNLLVLQSTSKKDENDTKSQSRRIAQLVRGKETRTPGTSRCTAGNGGELQMDEEALHAFELDEAIVVATCLVMLKREVDRRRMIQFAMMAGAAGGGP